MLLLISYRTDFQPEDYEEDIFMESNTEVSTTPKDFYLLYHEENPESNINTRPGIKLST